MEKTPALKAKLVAKVSAFLQEMDVAVDRLSVILVSFAVNSVIVALLCLNVRSTKILA